MIVDQTIKVVLDLDDIKKAVRAYLIDNTDIETEVIGSLIINFKVKDTNIGASGLMSNVQNFKLIEAICEHKG